MKTKFTEYELEKVFNFLDELRDSGITNMYAAPAYIERAYSFSRNKASDIFALWCKTFDGESSLVDRVEKAMEAQNEN